MKEYMEYKIKDVCSTFNLGVSKFYKLKEDLDNSIPEQNRREYYYNVGRNVFITEKGFEWFKNNSLKNNKQKISQNSSESDIVLYQNQIIDMYKQRVEYLELENKRLLDLVALKEQKEIAQEVKYIDNTNNSTGVSFWDKIFKKFKK